MKFLFPFLLLFTGCANAISTKFTFKDLDGSTLTVELPKEMEAVNLVVDINAKQGTAKITAEAIQTLNTGTIRAQANREAILSESITEGIAKGLVEGAKKGFIPIP